MKAKEQELPNGWTWARIGGKKGIAEIVNGATPATGEPQYWNGDILWATPADLGKLDSIYIADTERKITQEGLESCSTKLLPIGTVLLTSRAPVGNIAIAKKPICTNQGFKSFVPKEGIDSLYLYFAIKIIVPEIQKAGHGNTFTEITKDSVKSFEIPLPPTLDDQITIAKRLEKKMETTKNMRLAAARQLEASSSFMRSFSKTLFPFGDGHLPEKWTRKTLRDLSQSIEYGLSLSATRAPRGPRFVRITDIQDGEIVWDAVPYCECTDNEKIAAKLETGDILFARTGATTGKSFLVKDPPESVFASYLIRVKCKQDRVLPDYLYAFFQSTLYWDKISQGARGGAQPGFNATMLGDMFIPLPHTIDDQQQIASAFMGEGMRFKKIRDACGRQLEAISALPPAYLREFFTFDGKRDA